MLKIYDLCLINTFFFLLAGVNLTSKKSFTITISAMLLYICNFQKRKIGSRYYFKCSVFIHFFGCFVHLTHPVHVDLKKIVVKAEKNYNEILDKFIISVLSRFS